MTEKIVSPLIDEPSHTGGTGQRRSRSADKLEGWGQVGLSLRTEFFFWKGWGGFHNGVCPASFLLERCQPPPVLRGVEVIVFVLSGLARKEVTMV